MRLFVAILLPPDVRDALEPWVRSLGRGIRAARPEGLHITLRFVGELRPEPTERLIEGLRAQLGHRPALSLSVGGIGGFPDTARPRVVWAGVDGDLHALHDLAAAVDAVCLQVGLSPDRLPFVPHVTLGRVIEDGARGPTSLPHLGAFTVRDVRLMVSQSGPSGARYSEVARFPLDG